MTRLLINGCNGRMGQAIAQAAGQSTDMKVVAGVDKFPDAVRQAFPVFGSIASCTESADVLIDFSRPEALHDVLSYAMGHGTAAVLCTTGFSPDDLALIERASRHIPVFRSANMSLGVNLAVDLCRRAATFLGDSCDVEIIEKHHNAKVDAPSGTALMIADAINGAYLNSKSYTYGRHNANQKRSRGEIGIHAVRGGTIVGEHEMLFICADETLSIRHDIQNRQVFAMGALRAAQYLAGKGPGLYSMQDLLTEANAVTSISTDETQTLFSIRDIPLGGGVVRKLFAALWNAEINVDMISQTAPHQGRCSLAFTLPRLTGAAALPIVRDCCAAFEGCGLTTREDIVKISIEGPGMEHKPGVAARFFEALAAVGVEALAVTTSEIKVSCCVPEANRRSVVEALMKEFRL